MTDLSWFKAASARARLRRVLDDLGLVRVASTALFSMRLMENAEDTISRVIVDLDVEAPMIVHAVRVEAEYAYVDSLWVDSIEAQKRCDELAGSFNAYLVPMALKEEWRPGD